MPTREPIADLRQRLEQLNELEDEHAQARKSGRSALNSEALMESLRANIPLGVLTQHDRLRARGRRSIAEIHGSVCSGCHMGLPSGTMMEVKRASMLVKCDYCGRFVFLTDPEAPASATLPTKEKPANRR